MVFVLADASELDERRPFDPFEADALGKLSTDIGGEDT